MWPAEWVELQVEGAGPQLLRSQSDPEFSLDCHWSEAEEEEEAGLLPHLGSHWLLQEEEPHQ